MASALLIKGHGFQEGPVAIAAPHTSALRWLSIGRLGVVSGRAYEATTGDQEVVLDILSGTITLEAGAQRQSGLGGRGDPFSGGPTCVCLPPATPYRLTSDGPRADLLVLAAPAASGLPVAIVSPEDAPARTVGAANWARQIWPGTALGASTRRLMVGETINPPGNWSSYPPHKHDEDAPPQEAVYEEVYFFTVKPADGFGLQRLYERRAAPDALDEVFAVADGDAVIIPRGYHPVVAAPGYQLGYVWTLCGHGHVYGAWTNDPAHAWLLNVEPMLRG